MAHIIVVGNEKGGAGKSTVSMQVATALARLGHKVNALDLDLRQRTFGRYVENRHEFLKSSGLDLPSPDAHDLPEIDASVLKPGENIYDHRLSAAVATLEQNSDFILIDCPGSHTRLSQVAHSLADTLVTPINESFVDLDVFGKFQGERLRLEEIGPYGQMVTDARAQRTALDGGTIDWVVVRNRLAHLASHNHANVLAGLEFLAEELDFRLAAGIGERNIFREFFPMGLTAMDEFSIETLGTPPTMSHLAARREVRALVKRLNLPRPSKAPRQNAPAMTTSAFDDVMEAGRVLREEALQN